MSYPTNYDAKGLAPVIEILDGKQNVKHRYEHPQVSDSPIQDFKVLSWSIASGINSSAGNARIDIEDHDNEWTEGSRSRIRNSDILRIRLGKTADGLQNWFYGTIKEPQISRPGYNQKTISVQALGMINILAYRYVSINQVQDVGTDGDFDPNDQDSWVSNLAKKVLTDSSIRTIPSGGISFTTNGVSTIPVPVPFFQHNNQTQKSLIAELARIGNATYGITPDLDFYFHPGNRYTRYLATNKLTAKFPLDKLSIIRNKGYRWTDSSKTIKYTDDIAFGATRQARILDLTPQSSWQGVWSGLWVKLDAPLKNLTSLSFYLRSVKNNFSSRLSSGSLNIVKKSTPWSIPSNSAPNTSGLIGFVPKSEHGTDPLRQMGTTPQTVWNFFGIGSSSYGTVSQPKWVSHVLTDESREEWNSYFDPDAYYLLIASAFNAGGRRPIQINVPSGADSVFRRYSYPGGGSVPFIRRGKPTMRVNAELPTTVKAVNTIERHRIPARQTQHNYPNQQYDTVQLLTESGLDTASLARYTYSPVVVSSPDTRPEIGSKIHLQDVHMGINSYPTLIGYTINADRRERLAPTNIILNLEEYA